VKDEDGGGYRNGHWERNENHIPSYFEWWARLARAFGSSQDESEWKCPVRLEAGESHDEPAVVLLDGETSFRLETTRRFNDPLVEYKLGHCAELDDLPMRLRCKQATEDSIIDCFESTAVSMCGRGEFALDLTYTPEYEARALLGGALSYSDPLGHWVVDRAHADLHPPKSGRESPQGLRFPTTTDAWICGPYFFEGEWRGWSWDMYGAGFSADQFGERGPESWFAHRDIVGDGVGRARSPRTPVWYPSGDFLPWYFTRPCPLPYRGYPFKE